ncbi:DUF2806 domain-containing protein [Candidatus Poribacteria bacterium]|nr:DUF2806 domain-containing protein [Candidatus Poribacteria bacterium]
MSDEIEKNPPPTIADETNSAIDVVRDLVSDSTIPAPISRNMFKVIDRLCSALMDVPVGYLERRSAEKRSESEGRIRIQTEVTNQIIQQMKVDPEFPQRAGNRFAEKILREQFNLEKILSMTVGHLKKTEYDSSITENVEGDSEKTIQDDWLNDFENEACQKSSEEMQERFARILAGEIKRPGTFSIRAIKLLGQIDSETASIFRTFCSGCISFDAPAGSGFIYQSIFPSFDVGRTNRFLENYGISIPNLERLQEYSLLPANPGVNINYMGGVTLNIAEVFVETLPLIPSLNETSVAPFLYTNNYYFLRSRQSSLTPDWNFHMPGLQLSSIGQELINIVEFQQPIKQLSEDLKEFFAEKQLELVEVELTKDKHWKPKH